MSHTIKAHLALLCTNLFFAINYTVVKYFTTRGYAGPFGLNILRLGVGIVLFWGLFLLHPHREKISRKDVLAILACAVTAIVLNQLLFIRGLVYTLPIHASLLTLLTPILITLVAALVLKEKLTLEKVFGLLLGVSGAVLLIRNKEAVPPGDDLVLGDVLVLLSAIAYTFYFILVKPLTAKYPPVMLMRLVFTFGFFLTLPICYREFTEIRWSAFGSTEWLLIFLLTIPGTFLAYVFNAYGIQKLTASIAGAYIYSQPVFAIIISMIFLKEPLTVPKSLAAALIFTGVYLARRKPENELVKRLSA